MKKFASVLFATTFITLVAFGDTTKASELDSTLMDAGKVKYLQQEEVIVADKFSNDSMEEISKNNGKLKNQISNFSDEEFDRFMFNVVKNNSTNLEALEKKLELVDIEFEAPEQTINSFAIKPSQMTLQAYSTKRSGDSFYRLNSAWTHSVSEVYAASLDVVSIEWNSNVGTYYNAVAPSDGITTKRDRSTGIMTFNVEDDSLNFDSYATVYVTKRTSSPLEYRTKFVHTYSEVNSNINGELGIGFERGSISGSDTVKYPEKESFKILKSKIKVTYSKKIKNLEVIIPQSYRELLGNHIYWSGSTWEYPLPDTNGIEYNYEVILYTGETKDEELKKMLDMGNFIIIWEVNGVEKKKIYSIIENAVF